MLVYFTPLTSFLNISHWADHLYSPVIPGSWLTLEFLLKQNNPVQFLFPNPNFEKSKHVPWSQFNVLSSTELRSHAEQMCVATELLQRARVYWLFEGGQVRVNGDRAEVVDEGEGFRNVRGCPGVEETVEDALISTCGHRSSLSPWISLDSTLTNNV